MSALLEVRGLEVDFVQYERGLRRRTVTALAGMDLTAAAGEVVALVGASGAGKSLLAHAVLGLLPPNAVERGTVAYDGVHLDPEGRRRLAGRGIALLPQSVGFLDPLSRVGRQVRRSARLAGHPDPRRAAEEALARRGLGPEVLRLHPHELSGGMARRVLVAMATMSRTRVLVADEPTTGLPAATVATTLAEFRAMADEGCAVVLITHELVAALAVADRVVICRDGRTVDVADPRAFTGDGSSLRHPYTRSLWQALPANGFRVPTTAEA
ncbi:peptide/nickel transport system ATP-binding protein [Blastococcus sp. DSM 46786]|uniref:ATP-binding cassette domain-containing protein n=1 Tax=Blastococcus sp. DSM 46786 TaxID=1798227 RepID=UPI0008D839C2|nr:ATP-binding cassette domain-containing protein [Blastococcus sp. DSM 46786]SEM11097.1 peptide/nickel transport system ATP-binding protein [Blastococcus sp. DSM 46786]